MKFCTKCKQEKPEEEFWNQKTGKDGLTSRCKGCHKQYRIENKEKRRLNANVWRRKNRKKVHLYQKRHWDAHKNDPKIKKYRRNFNLKKYGITQDDYQEIFKRQGGVCAICGNVNPIGKRLAVDHDHISGMIRGLLCNPCNSALGFTNENEEILIKMISYLKFHRMGATQGT